MSAFDLTKHGLTVTEIHRNLPPGKLYEHAMRYEKDASITDNGALVSCSGLKTGRSPKDKRVVKHSASENHIWWGAVNIPLYPHTFEINRQRAQDYFNTREAVRDPIFGFDVVTECKAVPREVLLPRESWSNGSAYDAAAQKLAPLREELRDQRKWSERRGESGRAQRSAKRSGEGGVVDGFWCRGGVPTVGRAALDREDTVAAMGCVK